MMPVLSRALTSAGWCALRVNLRGVGRSDGGRNAGTGGLADVAAAVGRALAEEAVAPDLEALGPWRHLKLVVNGTEDHLADHGDVLIREVAAFAREVAGWARS